MICCCCSCCIGGHREYIFCWWMLVSHVLLSHVSRSWRHAIFGLVCPSASHSGNQFFPRLHNDGDTNTTPTAPKIITTTPAAAGWHTLFLASTSPLYSPHETQRLWVPLARLLMTQPQRHRRRSIDRVWPYRYWRTMSRRGINPPWWRYNKWPSRDCNYYCKLRIRCNN